MTPHIAEELLNSYKSSISSYDEVIDHNGQVKPYWKNIFATLEGIGLEKIGLRNQEIIHKLKENGVTYNVYNSNEATPRPWKLDPIPFLIHENEWKTIQGVIEEGLKNIQEFRVSEGGGGSTGIINITPVSTGTLTAGTVGSNQTICTGGDPAAEPGDHAARRRQFRPVAGLAAATDGLPGDRGPGQSARRQSRGDGVHGGDAAGALVRGDCRRQHHEQPFQPGFDPGHSAI